MLEDIRVSELLPVPVEQLFRAWLDSDAHTDFSGGGAEIDPTVNGKYSAWDGYIEGTTLEIDPPRRIVQTWRTSEFPSGSEDSRLEVLFEPEGDGTRLTLVHTRIPKGQGEKYRGGWEEFYFAPMRKYYGSRKGERS